MKAVLFAVSTVSGYLSGRFPGDAGTLLLIASVALLLAALTVPDIARERRPRGRARIWRDDLA